MFFFSCFTEGVQWFILRKTITFTSSRWGPTFSRECGGGGGSGSRQALTLDLCEMKNNLVSYNNIYWTGDPLNKVDSRLTTLCKIRNHLDAIDADKNLQRGTSRQAQTQMKCRAFSSYFGKRPLA